MDFRNALYIDPDHNVIDLEFDHPTYGWIPFTARTDDVEEHGRELFSLAVASGNVAAYIPPPPPTIEEIRAEMEPLTSRQFWMAAANIDIDKDVILTAIKTQMEDSIDRKMMIAELESSSFERDNPTVIDLMALMDIPAYQVDDLWVWAANL